MASTEDVMPWVGLYTAIASLLCVIAMTVDVIQGFWLWKLWFPNRFFSLNAATITLIAIAMKLPVDINTDKQSYEVIYVKLCSIYFLVTMLANFLPSLGLMDDGELLMNIVALGILVITIIVNILIQIYTNVLLVAPYTPPVLIFAILWPFSVALTVSTIRKNLQHRYKELQQLLSSYQEKSFSYKELKGYVKKCWMMAETRNPQFVIASSPVSSAFGVLCSILACISGTYLVLVRINNQGNWIGTEGYKWSIQIIYIVQSIGIVVGSIAPIFRCFTYVTHYNLSKKWSKNQLNVFRVEKHWIQRLQKWKRNHVHSHILSRHCQCCPESS